MKVLSGLYPYGSYEGEVFLHGGLCQFQNTRQSEDAGIAMIYQELALVPEMTVCENLFLGHEIATGGMIDWNKSYAQAEKILREVKLNVNPATKVSRLGIGEQQLVEIAKALLKKAQILILDEPTAALTEIEAENLLDLIRGLRAQGKTCLYVSHRLKEVFDIADDISILRDGCWVHSGPKAELTEQTLIRHMVGREITDIYPRIPRAVGGNTGTPVLEVRHWTVADPQSGRLVLNDVNFALYPGEVLGLAGLMGAGRTELVMSIFGCYGKLISGELLLNGKPLRIKSAEEAIDHGLALVTEDRKRYGLVLDMPIDKNATLSHLKFLAQFGVIDQNKEIAAAQYFTKTLGVKSASLEQHVRYLSGGNQQKVVLSKWLMTKPQVLILDEPTRGIDVGAKFEIYSMINTLLDQGICVFIISSELPEILGMSHRILVMHAGCLVADLPGTKETTQETIMAYATQEKGVPHP
jgi:D-xylose transport system ATP-binding protein